MSFFVKKLFPTAKNRATVAQKAFLDTNKIKTHNFKQVQNGEMDAYQQGANDAQSCWHAPHPSAPCDTIYNKEKQRLKNREKKSTETGNRGTA